MPADPPRVPYRGVQFQAPPEDVMGPVMRAVNQTVQQLPPGVNGALVATATTSGWNAVLIAKTNHTWTVQSWIGSKWGEPIEGGAQIIRTW